jgi:hypothetical protein
LNYTTLFNTIKAYVESDFPSTTFTGTNNDPNNPVTVTSSQQINTFIEQTELRIYNTIQFPSLRKNVTGTTYTGNKYLSCPIDFLSVYSMAVIDGSGNYSYLLNKDVNFIRESFPAASYTALPQYYAIFGPTTTDAPSPVITDELSFILGPTPNAAYTVELHYYYYPYSITDTENNPDGKTWLGDNCDTALLYGSLVEACTFLKGEADMMARYDAKYQEALGQAKRLGDGLERGDAYRNGQYRQKVT